MNFLAIVGAVAYVAKAIIGIRAEAKAKGVEATVRAVTAAAEKKAHDVTVALATSSSIMLQLVLTEREMTAESLIIKCKGVVAIQLAKVGIYEDQREPFQPLIDKAISAAVTKWLELHPTPHLQTLPIAGKLPS